MVKSSLKQQYTKRLTGRECGQIIEAIRNGDPSVNSASQKHSRFRLMTVARRMGCKARVNKQSEVPEIVIQLIAPLVFPAANKPPAKRR